MIRSSLRFLRNSASFEGDITWLKRGNTGVILVSTLKYNSWLWVVTNKIFQSYTEDLASLIFSKCIVILVTISHAINFMWSTLDNLSWSVFAPLHKSSLKKYWSKYQVTIKKNFYWDEIHIHHSKYINVLY